MIVDRSVLLGIVGGAHGIRGECRVRSFTADPTDIGAYGPLVDAAGRRYTVRSARAQKNVVVVRFAEVGTRDEAERLNGTELFVGRAALPEDDEDDFYQADLIGLRAVSAGGAVVGEVIAVHDFGAGDILEIRPARGATVMIPFSRAAVPEIDVEAGMLTVEPVAAGLVDDGAEEEPAQEPSGKASER